MKRGLSIGFAMTFGLLGACSSSSDSQVDAALDKQAAETISPVCGAPAPSLNLACSASARTSPRTASVERAVRERRRLPGRLHGPDVVLWIT